MDDAKIVDLYWQRADAAIEETDKKYGPYCRTIAYNILANPEDTEECVNDTYLGAWNAMPDKRPQRLSPFLGRIARNTALVRASEKSRLKRGGGEKELCLEELSECIPSQLSPEKALEAKELGLALRRFMATLSADERHIFTSRYFYVYSIDEIAAKHGFSQSKVKVTLHRTRKKLLRFLQEEELWTA